MYRLRNDAIILFKFADRLLLARRGACGRRGRIHAAHTARRPSAIRLGRFGGLVVAATGVRRRISARQWQIVHIADFQTRIVSPRLRPVAAHLLLLGVGVPIRGHHHHAPIIGHVDAFTAVIGRVLVVQFRVGLERVAAKVVKVRVGVRGRRGRGGVRGRSGAARATRVLVLVLVLVLVVEFARAIEALFVAWTVVEVVGRRVQRAIRVFGRGFGAVASARVSVMGVRRALMGFARHSGRIEVGGARGAAMRRGFVRRAMVMVM